VIKDARVLTIPPPPVQGLGSAGGFKMMLEDRAGLGSDAVVRAANDLVAAANKDPHFAGAFTLFNTGSPSVYADIDRVKAEKVGVTPTDVFFDAASLSGLPIRERLQLLAGRTKWSCKPTANIDATSRTSRD